MVDSDLDFTIFGESFSRFGDILRRFKDVKELASPVQEYQSCGKKIYTITRHEVKSEALLPIFTDSTAILSPLIRKKPADFLNLIFSNPSIQMIILDPPAEQSTEAPGEFKLDRNKISMLIGSIESRAEEENNSEIVKKILAELNKGNLHRANYLSGLAIIRKETPQITAIYPQILINLRLYQEAYDFIKNLPESPLTLYYSAIIFRVTGNLKKALEILSSIDQNAAMEDKKDLQMGWISLSSGNLNEAETKFRELLDKPLEKIEASIGLGMVLSKKGLLSKDYQTLKAALNILTESLNAPGFLNAQAHFYIGNIHLNTGKYPQAIEHYLKSLEQTLSIPTMINTIIAYIRLGKQKEAAGIISELALVDLDSATKTFSEFPKDNLNELNMIHPDISTLSSVSPISNISPSQKAEQETISQESLEKYPKEEPETKEKISAPAAAAQTEKESPEASLKPTEPLPQSDRIKAEDFPSPQKQSLREPPEPEKKTRMEFSLSIFSQNIQKTHALDNEKDEFMTRAFKLASLLEDETDKKIYFSMDGLTEVEKKLKVTFISEQIDSQQKLETLLDCASFLCYVLKEKYKGTIIKFSDFDPWAWPMIFKNNELVTYPIERVWRLMWLKQIPESGWLVKYVEYIDDIIGASSTKEHSGIEAAKNKTRGHPEKIIDAKTEHKRIMILNSTLEETKSIKITRSGILQIEDSLKTMFNPQTPPSTEGWKLLRCYAHIFAEILIKDFKASWFNTNGNDGLWSMTLPWKTFIFPLGKVYKCAASGESLTEYYEYLIEESERYKERLK